MDIIVDSFVELNGLLSKVGDECGDLIATAGNKMGDVLSHDGKIMWCGNGGSAADSQHLAAELVGRYKYNRRSLNSIALNADTSVLTCIANDFSYDEVFLRQIEGLGRQNDLLVCISTSGNSRNIVMAAEYARKKGIYTVGLLGGEGGVVAENVDCSIIVPSFNTARVQEVHILVGHILCDIIEHELHLNR